ncbi:hypothetical protein [Oceanobacter sp. 4_MG-2023]|uniref:hypothetical protein n=1 Tax=Oceanobacter sp. 4_MG-2023 TaxID=3062623 RepID=UPI002734707A|nr:hypothetical protein [Oceanobacter sp. 4_MG-2023]MDP2548510.1 hypothetical protein [Oceanobacter sp. 4_MG-2023]
MSELSESTLIAAIKAETGGRYEHIVAFARYNVDDQYCCNEGGAPTWVIASRLGMETADVRKALNKLQKRGLVCKHTRSNCNLWWPVGYLEELTTEGEYA